MPHEMETITFSQIGLLSLKFDLYKPSTFTSGDTKIPAVIFFHGGGMLAGCRQTLDFQSWLIDNTLLHSALFITADYRLLHPSTGLDVIADIHNLFTFLSAPSSLATYLPPNITLDTTRLAVVGESGGGYAALAAGIHAVPKPKAVFLQYAMGLDILSDRWVLQKDGGGDDPSGATAPPWRPKGEKPITRYSEGVRELFPPSSPAAQSTPSESDNLSLQPSKLPEIAWDPIVIPIPGRKPPAAAAGQISRRSDLLQVIWREGTLADYILSSPGLSARLHSLSFSDREAAVPDHLKPALLQSLLGADFPPTVLLHGGSDLLVDKEESVRLYEKLKAKGVKTEMVVVEGGGHALLDPKNMPSLVEGAKDGRERCWRFVWRELNA